MDVLLTSSRCMPSGVFAADPAPPTLSSLLKFGCSRQTNSYKISQRAILWTTLTRIYDFKSTCINTLKAIKDIPSSEISSEYHVQQNMVDLSSLYLQLRLLLSGDIEKNPGPGKKSADPPSRVEGAETYVIIPDPAPVPPPREPSFARDIPTSDAQQQNETSQLSPSHQTETNF